MPTAPNKTSIKNYLLQLRTKKWFRVITISMLSFVLSYSVLYKVISSPLFSLQKGNDFEMSDFYNQVANNRPTRTLNADIVVIGIDNCSRLDVAQIIQTISYTQPKAIGLDVFFSYKSTEDSLIIETFNQTPNLVLAYDAYHETSTAFAPALTQVHWGSVNLIAKQALGTIRQFKPSFNDSIYAFSAKLAQLTDSIAFQYLQERNNELETICYPSQEFEIINGIEILDGTIDLFTLEEMLYNKIVLVGDIHNPFDQHQTPISHNTPGIIINAYILATILNQSYIETTPTFINWTIAFIISILLSLMIVSFQGSNLLKSYTTFAIRIFQLLLIALFLYIGCYVFVHNHLYCNFAPSLLMVALGVLATAVEPIVYLVLRWCIKTCFFILHQSKKGLIFVKKVVCKLHKRYLQKKKKKQKQEQEQKN